jgi:hypothetical protein
MSKLTSHGHPVQNASVKLVEILKEQCLSWTASRFQTLNKSPYGLSVLKFMGEINLHTV